MFDPRLPRGGDQFIPRPPQAEIVRRAPWLDARSQPHEKRWTVSEVVDAVRGVEPAKAHIWRDDLELRTAAVLCGITETPAGASVILTKRSSNMRTHRGEISFPGGRLDEGETPLEAALRESHEEIGLQPSLVTPVAELNHVSTVVSTSYIVPIVGEVETHDHLSPMTGEVDKVLYVPMSELLHPDSFHEERWEVPMGRLPVLFFELPGETVYGATARMLFHLAVLITGTVDQLDLRPSN
jgi:8-oxo-dGTP pyrophosphatase MutT (NUDIX family)